MWVCDVSNVTVSNLSVSECKYERILMWVNEWVPRNVWFMLRGCVMVLMCCVKRKSAWVVGVFWCVVRFRGMHLGYAKRKKCAVSWWEMYATTKVYTQLTCRYPWLAHLVTKSFFTCEFLFFKNEEMTYRLYDVVEMKRMRGMLLKDETCLSQKVIGNNMLWPSEQFEESRISQLRPNPNMGCLQMLGAHEP